MRTQRIAIGASLAGMIVAALVAGCGGGGSGTSVSLPGGGGGHPSPTPPTLQLGNANIASGGTVAGGFTYNPASNDTIIFTCGCTNQAGITTSDVNGQFTVASPASPTPAAPSPQYTIVPTRNYIIVAEPPASNGGPQGWTMLFAGNTSATDLALGDTGPVVASSGTSDVYTTAIALLIYKESNPSSNEAFDDWNFNAVEGWLERMFTSPTPQETTLLNAIASESALGHSLFPSAPGWNPSQNTNATIKADLNSVIANPGSATPTPCPSGPSSCTATPTP
jgi:hypothetical protein